MASVGPPYLPTEDCLASPLMPVPIPKATNSISEVFFPQAKSFFLGSSHDTVGTALSNCVYLLFLMLAPRQGKNVCISSSSRKMDLYSMSTELSATRQVVLDRIKAHLILKVNQPSNLRLQNPVTIIKLTFSSYNNLRSSLYPALLYMYVFHLTINATLLYQCYSYFLDEEAAKLGENQVTRSVSHRL